MTSGAIPKAVNLILGSDKADDRVQKPLEEERLPMDRLGETDFSATVREVKKSFWYRVAAGPFSSPWYSIEAVDLPEIGNLKITAYPPHYTGLPTRTSYGGDIEGIRGSTLRVEAESTSSTKGEKCL
jgi:hypothetical protein